MISETHGRVVTYLNCSSYIDTFSFHVFIGGYLEEVPILDLNSSFFIKRISFSGHHVLFNMK